MGQHAEVQADQGPYTWSDFIALEEDDPRELLNGHLVELEVPTLMHERIVALIIFQLEGWSRARNAGLVLGSGYRIRIDETRGAMPDVQFYARGNFPTGQDKGLEQGRPDLAIEIISPTSRSKDSVRKLHDYASIGVPEYWLIDAEAQTFERLVLRNEVYSIVEALEGDGLFQPDSFEGLEIRLSELWGEPVEA